MQSSVCCCLQGRAGTAIHLEGLRQLQSMKGRDGQLTMDKWQKKNESTSRIWSQDVYRNVFSLRNVPVIAAAGRYPEIMCFCISFPKSCDFPSHSLCSLRSYIISKCSQFLWHALSAFTRKAATSVLSSSQVGFETFKIGIIGMSPTAKTTNHQPTNQTSVEHPAFAACARSRASSTAFWQAGLRLGGGLGAIKFPSYLVCSAMAII